MNLKIFSLFYVFVLLFSVGSGSPQFTDNGYDDVIVQIEDTVPEHLCSSIFKGIENKFKRASEVLYRATTQIAFFRSVVVVVPKSWKESECPSALESGPPPIEPPSIIVGDQHPIFMDIPWTLQEKGCGASGKAIYMTPTYLGTPSNSSAFGDSGRLLVHEWAKLRWGVFEEYGHVGDPVYPTFQQTDALRHKPNGCSDVDIQGIPESCDSSKKDCQFVPSISQNDEVTSSLMYLHYLPHVTKFCNALTHNSRAPTKQNALCDRRSVEEVMRRHPDFQNSVIGDENRDVIPTFRFIKPSERRYVIVIEDTNIMNVQKRWEFLRKAIWKLLVYDFPPGVEVGVVFFNEVSTVKLQLTRIPEARERRQILATRSLPRNPSQVAPTLKCVRCGIKEAIDMLRVNSKSSEGSVIFLISSGTPIPSVQSEDGRLEQIVRDAKVKVVPILYPVTGRNPQRFPGVERLTEITGTQFFAVLDEGMGSYSKIGMMVSLMKSLYAALRSFIPSPSQLPLLVHQKEFPGSIVSTSSDSFDIDKSLGGKVTLRLTYYDLGHVGNTITLIDPSGSPLSALQEEDSDVNTIFVTIRNATLGTWSYQIENRADSHQSLFIEVLSTPSESAPPADNTYRRVEKFGSDRPTQAVTLEGWMSSGKWVVNASDDSAPPLTVYAKLWSGRRPVIGAKVEVVLQRMGFNENGSSFMSQRLDLFDNGNGDADLTKNDGIYSRHLPRLGDAPARYTVSVEGSDSGGSASIMSPDHSQQPAWQRRNRDGTFFNLREKRAVTYGMSGPTCCGSVIPHTRAIKAERLSRSVSMGILDVIGSYSHSAGSLPPSRVGDLRVDINPATLYASFTWTSPGRERDYGKASRYDAIFARDFVSASLGQGEVIKDWPEPHWAGKESSYIIKWQVHDSLYFVSLRAVNRFNVAGPWSNVVRVYVPYPVTTTEQNPKGSSSTVSGNVGESIGELSPPEKSRGFLSQRDILGIVGAACGLLLIVLIFAIYYMVIGSRRREHKDKIVKDMESNGVPPNIPDRPDDETDSISKHPPELMPGPEHDPTVHRPLSPVQSWTASHLLAEHERRCSVDPTLGEVPEMGFAYPHPAFYYHTPNGHYIEDNIPIDSGSVVSTHRSDSLYKLDTSTAESLQNPMSPVGTTPVSWDSQPTGGKRTKVPPPTLPKPSFSTFDNCPSEQAVLERRRRNVTQV